MKMLSIYIISALMLSLPVHAQDANAQKALQKAQFMLRQASSEKAELQAQVDAQKKQIDKLTSDLAASKAASDQGKRTVEEKYGSAIAQWKQRDAQTTGELAVTKEQLKQQLAKRKTLEEQLQKQTNNFSACYENNKKLYDLNTQLLSRYEHKGFGDVLKQKEPFTGLKQVEVENLVQDYRYQLDDLKVQPEEAKAGSTEEPHQTDNKN